MSFTFAIITICKNSSSTLSRLITSVRRNYEFINEFIIVDGLSNDGTLDIINQNLDIITKYVSELDSGISDAFNKGISLSRSDFILFVNSDDFLLDENLKNISKVFNEDDDLILTPLAMFNGESYNIYSSNKDNLKNYSSVFHPGLIVRREAYLKYGLYSLEYRIAMDYDFICRAYIGGAKFKNIDLPIVVFSEGGISGRQYYRAVNEAFQIRKKYFNVWFPNYEIIKIILKGAGFLVKLFGFHKVLLAIKYKVYNYFFS